MNSKLRTPSTVAALACLVGPTLLALLYFVFLAQPLYQTEVRFLPQPGHDTTGAAPLLEAYLHSPELITQQDKALGLRTHFSQARKDPLQRLAPDAEDDPLRHYFQKKVTLHQTPDAPLLTLRVQSFSPEFTQQLADSLFQAMRLKWSEIHARSEPEEASLMVIAGPHRPDLPIRPRPFRGVATVFVLSALFYGIGRLLLATIRDHTV